MNCNCDHLDAYLADDLPVEDAARFAEHLEQCDGCRDVVDQQRWIDGLLRSGVKEVSVSPPKAVLESFRTSVLRRRRQSRQIACGLAAAAALVVAVGWTVLLNRQAGDRTKRSVEGAGLAASEHTHAIRQPRATFVGDADVIAVPVASRHADVTVVRIYSTYQPSYESETAAIEPDAATDFTWPDFSNGG